MYKFVQICTNLRNSNLYKFAQICTNLCKFVQICANLHFGLRVLSRDRLPKFAGWPAGNLQRTWGVELVWTGLGTGTGAGGPISRKSQAVDLPEPRAARFWGGPVVSVATSAGGGEALPVVERGLPQRLREAPLGLAGEEGGRAPDFPRTCPQSPGRAHGFPSRCEKTHRSR